MFDTWKGLITYFKLIFSVSFQYFHAFYLSDYPWEDDRASSGEEDSGWNTEVNKKDTQFQRLVDDRVRTVRKAS